MQKELSIIDGPSSPDLAAKIAQDLRAELIPVDVRIFSDGESRIKMGNVKKKNCVIVQSTYPPTDRHLLQTLMMIKKCTDDDAADICTVIPYMAYSRQDRAFQGGEVISMELIAKLLEAAGNKRLITIDIHSPLALSYFSINVQNISSIPLLANYAASNMKLNRAVVVSPDAGDALEAMDLGICGEERNVLPEGCRDDHAIRRVAMVPGELEASQPHGRGHRKQLDDPALLDAPRELRDRETEIELATLDLDAEFPDRDGAREPAAALHRLEAHGSSSR